jgi:UDP-N-acetylmuramoyl-tripeptide--D-alanyl-D-alanine ligase
VLAALQALGADAMRCLPALARVTAPVGRGARTLLDVPDGQILLIDESYNANPASVQAALAALATTPREAFGRRVAVLGDMLELGEASAELHRSLKGRLTRPASIWFLLAADDGCCWRSCRAAGA